jgi:release factor glutamine methyltransferase
MIAFENRGIREIKQLVTEGLTDLYDKQEAKSIAVLLIEGVLGFDKTKQLAEPDLVPIADDLTKLKNAYQRLLKSEPLQYVLGETEFYGRSFNVSPAVLIPRPETEELVEHCLRVLKGKKQTRILDLGTGSGAIAISLALEIPDARVYATDVSDDALHLAADNADRLGADVRFVHHDMLKEASFLPSELDLIVSNPPYVAEKEKSYMHSNVLDYEPEKALFVPDHEPVMFYRRIAEIGAEKLSHGGYCLCEINKSYEIESINSFKIAKFGNIIVYKDLNKNKRILQAKKP